MRLLQCLNCRTLEELPDYEGVPEGDIHLNYLLERHGPIDARHRGNLFLIEDNKWRQNKAEICKEIWSNCGYTGMEPEFYSAKNTFEEEALKCYNRHSRPKDGCVDWHEKSKRLGNPMIATDDKFRLKKKGFIIQSQTYLCDFCPVRFNYVQKKQFEKAGLYD